MTRYAKALVALFTALGTWGMTAAPDGYDSVELWGLCGVAVTFISVFAIPNTPPEGEPRDPNVSEMAPDAGRSDLESALLVGLAAFGFVALLFILL